MVKDAPTLRGHFVKFLERTKKFFWASVRSKLSISIVFMLVCGSDKHKQTDTRGNIRNSSPQVFMVICRQYGFLESDKLYVEVKIAIVDEILKMLFFILPINAWFKTYFSTFPNWLCNMKGREGGFSDTCCASNSDYIFYFKKYDGTFYVCYEIFLYIREFKFDFYFIPLLITSFLFF